MNKRSDISNFLTFDIEGFFEASVESLVIPKGYYSSKSEAQEIETNTMAIIEILSEYKVKGTFFILGRIARDMPHIIQNIASQGHEIACHSMEHRRLYNFRKQQVKEFLKKAKGYLEDASQSRVSGFRPPDFSIIKNNLWMHDILLELGFEYDSGVFPICFHDVYGIGEFGTSPSRLPNGLIELPMSISEILVNVPFGGGGYFRHYPYFITKFLGKRVNKRGDPFMHYLHPYEIGVVVPYIKELSWTKKIRTYNGVKTSSQKLQKLLSDFKFTTCKNWIDNHFENSIENI